MDFTDLSASNNSLLIAEVVLLGYCFTIITSISLLLIINANESFYLGKKIFFAFISLMVLLVRNVVYSVFTIIIADAFNLLFYH